MTDIRTSHPADCACPACRPEPSPGDIVLARVPPRHGGCGRTVPTPVLVLEVRDEGGERRVLVAPGAPATGRPARRGDLYLTADDLRGAPALNGPYLFVVRRPTLVPLGRDEAAAGAGPGLRLLGRLYGTAHARLEALRGRSPRRNRAAALA